MRILLSGVRSLIHADARFRPVQDAGISKITTVLFHMLGPSQHLVIGAAVGIGKVQLLMKVSSAAWFRAGLSLFHCESGGVGGVGVNLLA